MTDKERVDTFLSLFKKLEKEIIVQSKIKDDDFVSFSRALNKVHYDRLNPVIADQSNYDFLKTASDIRNMLSHEENTVIPTESFIQQFTRISDAIFCPKSCYNICSKQVFTCKYSDTITYIMDKMNKKGLSHVPVINHLGIVIGVFSRQTFFDAIRSGKEIENIEELQVSDFKDYLEFDSHSNEKYLFVSRDLSIKKAYELLLKKSTNGKNVPLLLVTHNGKQEEKLLGVITAIDLTKTTLEP